MLSEENNQWWDAGMPFTPVSKAWKFHIKKQHIVFKGQVMNHPQNKCTHFLISSPASKIDLTQKRVICHVTEKLRCKRLTFETVTAFYR